MTCKERVVGPGPAEAGPHVRSQSHTPAEAGPHAGSQSHTPAEVGPHVGSLYVGSAFRRTGLFLVVVLALLAPSAAGAQTAFADPRWHPWIGCWSSGQNGLTGVAARVCVVPADGPSAVELLTIKDGAVASRERIEASGQRRTTERDQCTGWETAEWSSDGKRVYLQSEHQCAGGTTRGSSGLIALSPDGDWLDVVSVSVGQNTGVRVLRHRPAAVPSDVPGEVAAALQSVAPARARDARVAAIGPFALADVAEAAQRVAAGVVTAWLNDVRQEFAVDAALLVDLANAKVPGRVIDMMVALAYPKAFAVPPSPTSAGVLAESESRIDGGGYAGFPPSSLIDCTSHFSVFGFGDCGTFAPGFGYGPGYGYSFSPFGPQFYGYLPFGFSPFGYGMYGYPSGYGGYGGWYSSEPTVVVIKGSEGATHGQVINGRGYSAGVSGTTASGGDSGGSSSGGSSVASGGGSVGASSADSGGDRTAHPR